MHAEAMLANAEEPPETFTLLPSVKGEAPRAAAIAAPR